MKFDDLLEILGDFGRYQKRLLLLSTLAVFCVAWQNYITIFTLPKLKHRCAIPGYDNDTYDIQNAHHEYLVNLSIPKSGEEGGHSNCLIYTSGNLTSASASGENATRVTCERWVYDQSIFKSTITGDLNLVCGNSLYRSHVYMAMFAGKFVAGITVGILSDILGRKRMYLVSACLLASASVFSVFISSVAMLLAARFLAAMSATATFLCVYVLVVEIMGRSQRKLTSIILQFLMVTGNIVMTGFAYFIRDWRGFTIALAVPSALLLPAWWFMEECPRWLLSKGRREEAVAILQRIATLNGVTLSKEQLGELSVEGEADVRALKPWLLFTRWRTATIYSALYANWILCSMAFYGITLNVNNLRGDLYLNFLLLALVDIIGQAFCLLLLDRLGRKFVFCSSAGLTGLALLALIVPAFTSGGDATATHTSMRVLSLFARMTMSAAYSTLYLYTAELWPTVLRNFGVGSSSTCSRLGATVSPYVVEIGLFVHGHFAEVLPLVVFGACALTAAVITLFLPETLKRGLPETIEDARRIHKESPDVSQEENKETTSRM